MNLEARMLVASWALIGLVADILFLVLFPFFLGSSTAGSKKKLELLFAAIFSRGLWCHVTCHVPLYTKRDFSLTIQVIVCT